MKNDSSEALDSHIMFASGHHDLVGNSIVHTVRKESVASLSPGDDGMKLIHMWLSAGVLTMTSGTFVWRRMIVLCG